MNSGDKQTKNKNKSINLTQEEQTLVCLFFGLLWQIDQDLQDKGSGK